MTENDIKGHVLILKELANTTAAQGLPPNDRQTIQLALASSFTLLECLLIDINRIANCAEEQLTRSKT